MKRVTLLVMIFLLSVMTQVRAQERLYDPSADAAAELRAALLRAASEGKHVLLQVGGNWCRWCIKLDHLMKQDPRIDSLLQSEYVLLRINYSKENRNEELLRRLGNPQRFGFPVLLVLDARGEVLHVQDSALLESGDGHDPEKVIRFLSMWTPQAIGTTADKH